MDVAIQIKTIVGVHTVCAKVTDEFLQWSKKVGNDLITPHPEFGFPGFKRWRFLVCVCYMVRKSY